MMPNKKFEMVVVDGVRYRPEDAPKAEPKVEAKEAGKPANKARSAVPNKEA